MKLEELQSLIQTGEGQLVEFKRSGTSHLGREICAFANSLGGRILIGVSDTGTVLPVEGGNALRSEIQSIARNLEPPLMVEIEEVGGVLVVGVPSSRFKPHSSSGKFHLREGATCQQMNRDEIREFFYREGLVYFDEKENDRFSWPDDLDQAAYGKMVEVCGITPSLAPEQLLANLGLLKNGCMTYAGSLLLGSNASRLVPGATINCCLFQGTTKTRILDQKTFGADFLSNYHSAVNYLGAHLNTAYEIGFERTDKLELPEGALREALLNAMGHRDYRKPGDLQVHIFQDRVEISNPGGLVGGLTLETLGTRSIPRNPLLFGMMQRMDLVEKVGSGLKRIHDMCREHGCPLPRIDADRDWYCLSFERLGTKDEQVTRQVPDKYPASTRQVLVALASASHALPRSSLQEAAKFHDREHFVNEHLRPLLAAGMIEMTIPDKPTSSKQKYRITPAGRKLLENKDAQ
ncbi:MAG: ATP-binding protein [Verrucomicrobiota bacterium]|nr:ATP-binding protein [Verrucomicrobiota bacterium]